LPARPNGKRIAHSRGRNAPLNPERLHSIKVAAALIPRICSRQHQA
jgi:hypothetical protein